MSCLLSDNAKANSFFYKEIWDSILINIDMGTFRVPKTYDTLLKYYYKDYMKVPALKSRIDEVLVHYKELTKFGKQKND